jgi:hypothetical protein
MLALATDKQRAFVSALYDEEAPLKGDGLLIYAARKAGYGNKEGTSTNRSLGVIADRVVHDDRVRAAISEYSRNIVRAISPEAVRAVRNLIRDPKAKDHARAVAMVLDCVDPIETTHTVKIEDYQPPTLEMTEKVLQRIEDLMRSAGMLPKPSPILDGEFKVVEHE